MNRRFSWVAAGQLTLLTMLGLLLAGGLHFPGGYGTLRWNPAEYDWSGSVLGFIFGAISGLFVAGAQALVLRAWGVPTGRWLLFNALGYGLVHAVADALPYRPLTTIGGGIVVPLCQYLALRRHLTKPWVWLPIAACAWWLGFGLSAGPQGYNFLVVTVLAAATGLAFRLLLVPAPPPAPNRWWASLTRLKRAVLVIGLLVGLVSFLVVFAAATGLLGTG